MILADTSVWIDHLRRDDPELASLLASGQVLGHPWVVGELALGSLARRHEVLALLDQLPRAALATADEVRGLVERADLAGRGIGYVDAQLLASTMLTPGARLWTRDRRLAAAAADLGLVHGGTGR